MGLTIGGTEVAPGERCHIDIPLADIPATQLEMPLSVEVVSGRRPGPTVWISGTIHGDELNGIEIIRQVLDELDAEQLRGTVLAVPIVNMFGFVLGSRYLPDRRDLNRSFPGSAKGSLAARVAAKFMEEIVAPCSHGIDLHTGSDHRRNLPQVRADLTHAETRACALAFGAPVTIDSHTRDGSLRDAAGRLGKQVLLYEAGEPHRFNRDAVRVGVNGVLRVLRHLDMVPPAPAGGAMPDLPPAATRIATKSQWLRARASGLARLKVHLGDTVAAKQRVAVISNAFGHDVHVIRAARAGLVIGRAGNPVVREGDAIVHIATEFEE